MFKGFIATFIISFLALPHIAKTSQKRSICFFHPYERQDMLEKIRNRDDLTPIYVIPEVREGSGLEQTPIDNEKLDSMSMITADRGYVFKRGKVDELKAGDFVLESYSFRSFGFVVFASREVRIKLSYYDGNGNFIRFYNGDDKQFTAGTECNRIDDALEDLDPKDQLIL